MFNKHKSWVEPTKTIASAPHLNKSLARINKNPFHQGFLTDMVTIDWCESLIRFYNVYKLPLY